MSKDYVMQLEATIENLRRDNALLKEMKNEQEKVLGILNPYLRLVDNFLQVKVDVLFNCWVVVKEITNKEELEVLNKTLGQTEPSVAYVVKNY